MKNRNSNSLLHALLPVAAVIVYVLLGYLFKSKGWAVGWLVFLLIPIIESAAAAFKAKNPSAFSYPVFVTAVFLSIGLIFHIWHPTWVLFVTIPAFYAICDYVNKNRQQRAFENAEQNPTMPTPPPFPQAGETPPYVQYPQYPYNQPKKSNAVPIVVSVIFSITAIIIAGIIATFSFLKGNSTGLVNFNFDKDGYTEINSSAEFETDSIHNIDIEWINGKIDIEYYDGETIYVEETGNLKYPMCYKIDHGTLEIDEYYAEIKASSLNASNKDLTVKIPKAFKADEFDISTVSSNVYAKEINARDFDFETVSGNGDFQFASSPSKIETDSVSGDVRITLPSDVSGYSVSRDTVSGSFSASDFNNESRYGDGSVLIKSESVSGNLTLTKSESKTVTI